MNFKSKRNQFNALLIQFLILFMYIEILIVYDDKYLLLSIFGTLILLVLQAVLIIMNNGLNLDQKMAVGITKFLSIILIIVGYYLNSSDLQRTSSPIWLIQFLLIVKRDNEKTRIGLEEETSEQQISVEQFSSQLILQKKKYKQMRKEILSQIQIDTSITLEIEINLEKAGCYQLDTDLISKEFTQLRSPIVQSENQFSIVNELIDNQLFFLEQQERLQEQILNYQNDSSKQFQSIIIQIKQLKSQQEEKIKEIEGLNSNLIFQLTEDIKSIEQSLQKSRINIEQLNKSQDDKLQSILKSQNTRKQNITVFQKTIKSQTKFIKKINTKIENKLMKIQIYQFELRKISSNFEIDHQEKSIEYFIENKLEEIIANPQTTAKTFLMQFISEQWKERILLQIEMKAKQKSN